jgi:hypothetical protein
MGILSQVDSVEQYQVSLTYFSYPWSCLEYLTIFYLQVFQAYFVCSLYLKSSIFTGSSCSLECGILVFYFAFFIYWLSSWHNTIFVLVIWDASLKYNIYICNYAYFCMFYSIPLVPLYFLVSVPQCFNHRGVNSSGLPAFPNHLVSRVFLAILA